MNELERIFILDERRFGKQMTAAFRCFKDDGVKLRVGLFCVVSSIVFLQVAGVGEFCLVLKKLQQILAVQKGHAVSWEVVNVCQRG